MKEKKGDQGNQVRKLPQPRNRYYINEPVIVLRMGEFERLIHHLVSLGLKDAQPENVQRGLERRHTMILQECRQKLSDAKNHYLIKE
ncbi:hypothetical protein [Tellurirhabdus bombi]|uniref:hypothetical protein n=1 Tax=Tellurirhabdus bombi TaxID=2907205 RepID=UPI001F2927A0|nr:hypothetical protein [Tellurirhabdus bombi]